MALSRLKMDFSTEVGLDARLGSEDRFRCLNFLAGFQRLRCQS